MGKAFSLTDIFQSKKKNMLRLQNVFKCYHVSIISVHMLLCNGICHLAFLQVFFLYTLNIFLPIFLGLCLFIISLWVHLIGFSCMFSAKETHTQECRVLGWEQRIRIPLSVLESTDVILRSQAS